MQEEFYIGWQAEAPPSFARVVRRFVIGMCVLVPASALLIAYFQNGFSNGTFEFGKTTELEGIYSEQPFPFLTIENGKDATGKPVVQKILLVGKGKFGFTVDSGRYTVDGTRYTVDGTRYTVDGRRQTIDGGRWTVDGGRWTVDGGRWTVDGGRYTVDGQKIKISGTLIYNDGKTAFEVESIHSDGANASYPVTHPHAPPSTVHHLPSTVQLRGEITDPKCLLGVMNPGQGKPHRDCAVRCIAGGIPPVLKVANTAGETEYYLLAGPGGEPVNDRVLEYVGDGVQVCGRLEQEGDWLVLYADPATIQRVNKGSLNTGVMCN